VNLLSFLRILFGMLIIYLNLQSNIFHLVRNLMYNKFLSMIITHYCQPSIKEINCISLINLLYL
jgi:hypothetical protein